MDDLTTELLTYLAEPSRQSVGDNRLFARLAEAKSVVRVGPVWIFCRYDLVTRLASDPRCLLRLPDSWSRIQHPDPDIVALTERLLPIQPPANHLRLRRALAGEFRPRSIDRLAEDVNDIVAELFAPALASGHCDFIADICHPLPVFTTAALLGIPRSDRTNLLSWADQLNSAISSQFESLGSWPGASAGPATTPVAASSNGLAEVVEYIDLLVRDRRSNPGEDLVSRLTIQADSSEDPLTHDELVALVATVFMTGIDTVGSALANVVMALSSRPDVWQQVVADPGLASNAFSEGSRLHPALPVSSRLVDADIEIAGAVMPAGSVALLLYGAANLDPKVFPDPAKFDLHRSETHHLGFGHGPHYCLGASLAILQAITVLRTLAQRAPEFTIVGDTDQRRREFAFHSVRQLPLRLPVSTTRPAGVAG